MRFLTGVNRFIKKIAWVVILQNIIASFITGVCLYQLYRGWDDMRSHRSTGQYQWNRLDSGVWYSHYVGVGGSSTEEARHRFYGMSTERQTLASMDTLFLVMYVDYPVYMSGMEMVITARGSTLRLGHEMIMDFLPDASGARWEVATSETRRAPEGYIRVRVELTRFLVNP